jgi:hypothetical protein
MKLNKNLLALRLMDATNCSEIKALKLVDEYILLCAKQILQHLNKTTDDYVYVSLDDLRRQLGDIKVKGQRYYVWNEFQKFNERIIVPITVGSNISEKLTMATLNYDLEDIILASGNGAELVEHLYRPFEDEQLEPELVPINMSSLDAYIQGNRDIDRNDPKNKNKIERVDYYLKQAQRIRLIAQTFDGYMPHIPNESEFGRRYYRGPNLQNTSKIVRHAALGTCHEYDIESSVFAWKLSWFRQICTDQGFGLITRPATLEYLDHKDAIRNQVAEEVFGSRNPGYVSYVKQAITAIGFGAPARASGYVTPNRYEPSALSTIIKSPEKLKTFLAHKWVVDFVQEQQQMNAIIIEFCHNQQLTDHFKTIPDLLDRAGRIRPNSVISYLYQKSEREILRWIIEHIESSEILLAVHDCVYTRRPADLRELRSGIRQFGEFYNISHESHEAFAYDSELQEHRERIAQEEQRAHERFGHLTRPDPRLINHSILSASDNQLVDSQCDFGDQAVTDYQPDYDPYYQALSEQERRQYLTHRAGKSELPQWVQQRIKE